MSDREMDVNFGALEIGIVVNLRILREVLAELNAEGKRWWIASDPDDAIATKSITIGHGDQHCGDRYNTVFFRIPILNDQMPRAGSSQIVLLFEAANLFDEKRDCVRNGGGGLQDILEDFRAFFLPIHQKLLDKLLTNS